MMIIKYTDGINSDFIRLCRQLDAYLNELAGGEENRAEYISYNTLDNIHDVWLAYENNVPAGCVSYRKVTSDTAELKRLFVLEKYRRNKIAGRLMRELEAKARQQGFSRLLLETGEPLAAATNFYRKLGYRIIDNYGPYVEKPASICMEKWL